jgi:hypothetical protein
MSDQPTTPEPESPDTSSDCGGRRLSACSPIWTLGRLKLCVRWDFEGHWLTSPSGSRNMLWLWIGPTRSKDNLTVWNFVCGPFGVAAAWVNAQVVAPPTMDSALPKDVPGG